MRKNKFCKVEKETDLKAYQMYEQGMSLTKIANELCIDRASLSKRLQNMGLKLRPNRTYDCDLNYFEIIDTEHKAYWLGFIMADGCINKNQTFEITLKEEDRYMLEILKCDIKSNAPLVEKVINFNGYTYKAVRLGVCRKQFGQHLIHKGVVSNKSAIIRIPFDSIPKQLIHHFIRGYFDGDGCISITIKDNSKNPTRNAVMIVITSGSLEMLHDIQTVLSDQNIHPKLITKSQTCYEMRIFRNVEKERFFDYIYKDATIFLARKYVKRMQFAVMRSRL